MSLSSIIQNLPSAVQAAWLRRWRTQQQVDQLDQSIGNGYEWYARDSNDANDLPLIGYDTGNQLRVGGAVNTPLRSQVSVHLYPNANQVAQTFFTNPTPFPIYVTGISEVHTTAGSVAGAAAYISHETQVGGLMQAAGTGTSVMSGTFDLHGTAATVQNATLVTNYRLQSRNLASNASAPASTVNSGVIVVQPGDSLSIKYSGTLTSLIGVTITLYMAPGGKYNFASYYLAAAGGAATASLLTSLRPRTLAYAAALWQVKEATAGSLALSLTKDASGTAPGAGTAMLASTVNLKGTALTYTQMSLSVTAANLKTAPTDSVAVKVSAAATELAGVCVTLAFVGTQNEVFINYNPVNSTAGTNEEFWIADRDYEVLDFAGKWSTVGGTGARAALTSETGTATPASGGQVLQTDNTSAGFDLTGTVDTPNFATLSAQNTRFLRQGDRLGLKNAGTLGSLAGLQISARLRAM